MTASRHRWLIPLAALAAILPLLLHGPSCGHDFDFHLLSWLEAQTQLAHGSWPQWAFTPAWNAGEPRFLFYPPLSWLLGAALTAILPFNLVPIAFTFLALTASGFTMHRLAAAHAPTAATAAAILYLLNPYMLFTAYERTAYGELLAAAFLPLLFAAILAEHPRASTIALPITLLWLTNAPAAVMGSYALALLTIARLALAKRSRLPLAQASLGGMLLGLALAAFYIVPAAYQRRFVQIAMAVIPGMAPPDNFLFHHTADAPHDAVLHTASLVACTLLLTAAASLFAGRRRLHSNLLISLSSLAAAIALLLTPISAIAWRYLPELAFLQFPWRLLALLSIVAALALAVSLPALSRPRLAIAATLALATLLVLPTWHQFRQSCDAEDAPSGRAAAFHANTGTEPTDEYTPLQADGDALHPGDPPFWLTTDPQQPPPPGSPGPTPPILRLHLDHPAYLILNRRQYPSWLVTLNGRIVTPSPPRDDGLIALPLPAGDDTIQLTLHRTPDQWAGLALSACALVLLLILLRRRSYKLA